MPQTRKIEIFSAGCAACENTIAQIADRACPSCDLIVLDMKGKGIAARAKARGVRSVPAVVALCCFTPILVLLLGVIGVSAVVGWLDYVLFPTLAVFVGITIYAFWKRRSA